MQNLAGHVRSTEIITHELTRCGIEIVESDKPLGEPKSMVKGKLGNFDFQRAWYYWMVKGLVPMNVANELYANRIGRTDIRSGGHCGCPSPSEYGAERFNPKTGIRMTGTREAKEYPDAVKSLGWEVNDEGGEMFVTSYHIDSELGLYLFVEALKKHKLV